MNESHLHFYYLILNRTHTHFKHLVEPISTTYSSLYLVWTVFLSIVWRGKDRLGNCERVVGDLFTTGFINFVVVPYKTARRSQYFIGHIVMSIM